ncbi:MAG: hypothetical protein BWY78_01481 [Alphaproteobacteria bacterium ADurb.Bin438]|nr:MAG: hypothetical protein BWY78_01481 [Alphaproteobacteria bacterium ADurb.Bin438]
MNKIVNETEYQNIGIATHGGIIRALSLHFNFELGFIPNGSIFHIVHDGEYIVKGVI